MPSWATITAEDFTADGWLSNNPKFADVHPALREPDMIRASQQALPLHYASGLSESSDGSSGDRSIPFAEGLLHPAELENLARLYDTLGLDGGSDKISLQPEGQAAFRDASMQDVVRAAPQNRKYGDRSQHPRAPTSQPVTSSPGSPRYSLFPAPPRTPPKGNKPFGARLEQPPPPIPEMSSRRVRHIAPPSSYLAPSSDGLTSNTNTDSQRTSSLNSSTQYLHQRFSKQHPDPISQSMRPASQSNLPDPLAALPTPVASARSSMALPANEAPFGSHQVLANVAELRVAPMSPDPHPGRCLQIGDSSIISQWSSESQRSSRASQARSSSSEPSSRRNSHRRTLASFTGSSKLKSMLKVSNPLIEAAKTNDLPMLLHHLAPGPSNTSTALSPTDKDGLTPLHWAAKLGHLEIAQALLARNVHTEKHSKFQDRTPLYYAAWNNHASLVAVLIEAGAAVNATSKMDGATALHKASQQGHEDCIRILLAANAHVNQRDVEGMPPLMWAFQGKQLRAAQMLILAGANLEARIRLGVNLEASTMQGLTVLHKAVQQGNHLFARLFLEMGADANSDSPYDLAPLHRAAGKGDYDMVQLLLEYGGNIDVRNEAGWTPLHSAARYGHRRVAQCLLGAGAERNAMTRDGESAVELAKRNGFVDVL